jgi:hypothetical protein
VDYEYVWHGKDQSILSNHMEQILKQSGKTREDLTEALYDTLKHSERWNARHDRPTLPARPPAAGAVMLDAPLQRHPPTCDDTLERSLAYVIAKAMRGSEADPVMVGDDHRRAGHAVVNHLVMLRSAPEV